MQVSFVIPLFNCLPLTQACVASLQKSLPSNLDYEIILIDDGSTDETRSWLGSLSSPYRVILNPSNLGYAKSNNLGAQSARGNILCLINNDLIFTRGWWAPLHTLYQKLGKRAGAIGNVQRRVSDRSIDHSGIRINYQGKPEHDRNWYPWPRRHRFVPAVTGACLMLSRATFLKNDGFDESYINGGEDVDLCFRLSQQGLTNAIALRSVISHHVSASPGRKQRDESNSYRLALKWREQLAGHAVRSWCQHFLNQHWSASGDSLAWPEAIDYLFYVLHLRSKPPESARLGVQVTMNNEIKRWDSLFPKHTATGLDS